MSMHTCVEVRGQLGGIGLSFYVGSRINPRVTDLAVSACIC